MSIMRFTPCVLLVFALLVPGASTSLDQPAASPTAPASSAAPGSMLIVENVGQWPAAARFQVWNSPLGAGTTWLAEDAIWLVVASGKSQVADGKWQVAGSESHADPLADLPPANLQPATLHALKLTFPGSNPDVRIEPFQPLTTTVSYFIGNDPEQWRPAVPVWGGVRYVDLYPGVDLVLGGRDGVWRLDAAPGAAVEQVRVQVEGAAVVALDGSMLHLEGAGAPLFVTLPSAPFAYQAAGRSLQGVPLALPMHPCLRTTHPARPFDDSSDLLYSSFLGGSSWDEGKAIAVDEAGSAYVTGGTWSSDFPTTPGAFDPDHNGGIDVFLVKLNPAGNQLVYATLLGGGSNEAGESIALDGMGSVYVTGSSDSTDFPTTPGAFDPGVDFVEDAFVTKLNPAGSRLVYSTCMGGGNHDFGNAIAVDGTGNAYITGSTDSSDFPTTPGAFSSSLGGYWDAFVAKLNPTGSGLVYATYLGSIVYYDAGFAIAVDVMGSAYVTGWTLSNGFPTTPGAFDPTYNGGYDAFVAKLNPAGSALVYATHLGGSYNDRGSAVLVDGMGSAFVAGETNSTGFPTTPGAFDPTYNGGDCDDYPCYDAFVAKLNPAGSELTYATFLGGNGDELSPEIAVNEAGSAYLAGRTNSTGFPTTPGAFDPSHNGGDCGSYPCFEAFAARLNPAGSGLVYATYLGGNSGDKGWAIAIDQAGSAYITGDTESSDFPTSSGAFDTSFNGYNDVFVAKLAMQPYSSNVVAAIEQPHAGALVTGTVALSGFAIDLNSPSDTGIDMVHIYLDGSYGTGTIIGGATYGLSRPDIAAQYGARFGPSGWTLAWDTTGLAPGVHRLYLYAHRTADEAWSLMPSHLVLVAGSPTIWLPIGLRNR